MMDVEARRKKLLMEQRELQNEVVALNSKMENVRYALHQLDNVLVNSTDKKIVIINDVGKKYKELKICQKRKK
jgi:hypothetical protein